jgi:hypothetical protein
LSEQEIKCALVHHIRKKMIIKVLVSWPDFCIF